MVIDYKLIWIDAKGRQCCTKPEFGELEAIAYAQFLSLIEGREFAIDGNKREGGDR